MTAREPNMCHIVHAPAPRGAVQPLFLPLPGRPLVPCTGCEQPTAADIALVRQAQEGTLQALTPPEDQEHRVPYRWWVGHQAAFVLWQLLAESLAAMLRASTLSRHAVAQAATMYDAYSALLLYTGSCSADHYAVTLRTAMNRCHPAFSGEWARDHEQIPELLQKIRTKYPQTLTASLTEAHRANNRVHMAVAKALVPGGTSLLQLAGRRPGGGPSTGEYNCYDGFFLVARRTVCHRGRNAQLLRRLAQISCDLALHGLQPPGVPAPCLPGPKAHTVDRISRDAAGILLRLAESMLAPPNRTDRPAVRTVPSR